MIKASGGGQVLVAIDAGDVDAAVALATRLRGTVGGVKPGLEFFAAAGPAGVRTLAAVGRRGPAVDEVRRLAALCRRSGLDGVVCVPGEKAALRADLCPDFRLGVRPSRAAAGDQKRVTTPAGDQKRVTTPADAVAAGADRLVIGRPITAAGDPLAAARRIGEEIAAATGGATAARAGAA